MSSEGIRSCPDCRSVFTVDTQFCGRDGCALVTGTDDPLVGNAIERYEIVGLLGAGAMGRVYRARHQELEREYALKVLYGQLAADRTILERFRLEARAISRLDHPNIVRVYDFGTPESAPAFLALELLNGQTLKDKLASCGTLPPEDAIDIAIQVAKALESAHEANVIHRDLKPANLMLSEGHVTVLDFGIARLSDDSNLRTRLTQEGRSLGTPVYLAPEQVYDSTVGPSADLYALGVILFEMLSGKPPFAGEDVLRAKTMHPAPELKGVAEDLVAALLERDPAVRPHSARSVRKSLEALREAHEPSRSSGASEGAAIEVAKAPEQAASLEPTGSEPTGSELTGSELTGSEPTGSELTGSEPTGSEPIGETNGTNPRRAPLVAVGAIAGAALIGALVFDLGGSEDDRRAETTVDSGIARKAAVVAGTQVPSATPNADVPSTTPNTTVPSTTPNTAVPSTAPNTEVSPKADAPPTGDARRKRVGASSVAKTHPPPSSRRRVTPRVDISSVVKEQKERVKRVLAKKGLQPVDCPQIAALSKKHERWLAAQKGKDAKALRTAADALVSSIEDYRVELPDLRRRLVRMQDALTNLPEGASELEDRYLDLSSAVRPGLSAQRRQQLAKQLHDLHGRMVRSR